MFRTLFVVSTKCTDNATISLRDYAIFMNTNCKYNVLFTSFYVHSIDTCNKRWKRCSGTRSTLRFVRLKRELIKTECGEYSGKMKNRDENGITSGVKRIQPLCDRWRNNVNHCFGSLSISTCIIFVSDFWANSIDCFSRLSVSLRPSFYFCLDFTIHFVIIIFLRISSRHEFNVTCVLECLSGCNVRLVSKQCTPKCKNHFLQRNRASTKLQKKSFFF